VIAEMVYWKVDSLVLTMGKSKVVLMGKMTESIMVGRSGNSSAENSDVKLAALSDK